MQKKTNSKDAISPSEKNLRDFSNKYYNRTRLNRIEKKAFDKKKSTLFSRQVKEQLAENFESMLVKLEKSFKSFKRISMMSSSDYKTKEDYRKDLNRVTLKAKAKDTNKILAADPKTYIRFFDYFAKVSDKSRRSTYEKATFKTPFHPGYYQNVDFDDIKSKCDEVIFELTDILNEVDKEMGILDSYRKINQESIKAIKNREYTENSVWPQTTIDDGYSVEKFRNTIEPKYSLQMVSYFEENFLEETNQLETTLQDADKSLFDNPADVKLLESLIWDNIDRPARKRDIWLTPMGIYHHIDEYSPNTLSYFYLEPDSISLMPQMYLGMLSYGYDKNNIVWFSRWEDMKEEYAISQRDINNPKVEDWEKDYLYIAAYPSEDGKSLIPILRNGCEEGTRIDILDEDCLFNYANSYIATPNVKRKNKGDLPTLLQYLFTIIVNGTFKEAIKNTAYLLKENPLLVSKKEKRAQYEAFLAYKKNKMKK